MGKETYRQIGLSILAGKIYAPVISKKNKNRRTTY
jgi:hypothetical protein